MNFYRVRIRCSNGFKSCFKYHQSVWLSWFAIYKFNGLNIIAWPINKSIPLHLYYLTKASYPLHSRSFSHVQNKVAFLSSPSGDLRLRVFGDSLVSRMNWGFLFPFLVSLANTSCCSSLLPLEASASFFDLKIRALVEVSILCLAPALRAPLLIDSGIWVLHCRFLFEATASFNLELKLRVWNWVIWCCLALLRASVNSTLLLVRF